MKTLKAFVCGAALLSMTACATGTPIAGQTIDDSYRVDGFRWDSGTTVYVMLKTFNADGKTGVCGAWTARGGSSNISHLNTEMMDAGSVALDGTTLVNGLGFMKEHGGTGDLKGQASNCVKTDVDWQPAFANERPDAVFPRMRFVL